MLCWQLIAEICVDGFGSEDESLKSLMQWLQADYRGFGGGGFGIPVVSYAPRPMLQDCTSLVIILEVCWC